MAGELPTGLVAGVLGGAFGLGPVLFDGATEQAQPVVGGVPDQQVLRHRPWAGVTGLRRIAVTGVFASVGSAVLQ